MDLEKTIRTCRELTPAEYKIGQFILRYPEEVVRMTGKEMEMRLYVSKSAIYRFCKKIGLDGFNELKLQVVSSMKNSGQPASGTWVDVNLPFQAQDEPAVIGERLTALYQRIIKETEDMIEWDVLEKVIEVLQNHPPIHIFTHFHNANIAGLFQDKMCRIGYEVTVDSEDKIAKARIIQNESCALIISYTGKTLHIKSLSEVLKKRNIPTILITANKEQFVRSCADLVLYIPGGEEMKTRMGQFASDMELNYILDVIYGCMLNTDRTRAMYFMDRILDGYE